MMVERAVCTKQGDLCRCVLGKYASAVSPQSDPGVCRARRKVFLDSRVTGPPVGLSLQGTACLLLVPAVPQVAIRGQQSAFKDHSSS